MSNRIHTPAAVAHKRNCNYGGVVTFLVEEETLFEEEERKLERKRKNHVGRGESKGPAGMREDREN